MNTTETELKKRLQEIIIEDKYEIISSTITGHWEAFVKVKDKKNGETLSYQIMSDG